MFAALLFALDAQLTEDKSSFEVARIERKEKALG